MSSVLSAKPRPFSRDAVSSVSGRVMSAGVVKTDKPRPASTKRHLSKKASKSSSDELRAKEEEYR